VAGNVEIAAAQAHRFQKEGADIIDVGGESTSPDAQPTPTGEELQRVVPVVKRLVAEVSLPISIDTYKSEVARAALDAGACMINDVWGLKKDPRLAELAAKRGVPIVLTSNQRGDNPSDIIAAINSGLRRSMDTALEEGVPRHNIILDPGVGFGKTLEQNLEVIRRLSELRVLGQPILLGTSRKSIIGLVLNLPPDQRLEGTAATVAIGIANGADIVRVHDVLQMVHVSRMSDAVVRKRCP
jgi:dihydropteroate synthase